MTTTIYGLRCPVENKIRYVGVSTNPGRRYAEHLTPKSANPVKNEWISALRQAGLRPSLEILEEVTAAVSKVAERRWILDLLEQGHTLTNSHNITPPSPLPEPRLPVATEEQTLRVKELRQRSGMSRSALAEAVGTSPQTIWNIEEQDSVPNLLLAMKIARALGVPVEELVREE